MSQFLSRAAIAAFCAVAISTTVAAQAPVQPDSANAPAPAEARTVATIMAPSVDASLAYRPVRPEVSSIVRRRAFDRPVVLMIVGGALIVTGLLVGSDAAPILYIAGAGIGGYGLYLYLQSPNTTMRR